MSVSITEISSQYFTGKPCKRGHLSDRFISGKCIECNRILDSKYRAENPQKGRDKTEKWRLANKLSRAKYMRDYRARQPKKEKPKFSKSKYMNTYVKNRYATDINYKLAFLLRCRIRIALNKGYKAGSAVRDLGCSIEYFRKYLETHKNWKCSFTWENHGELWELDHVTALGLFDLKDRDQFLKAAHYTNFQPLSIDDHRLKTISDIILIRDQKENVS